MQDISRSLRLHVQKITKLPTIPIVAQEILSLLHDDLVTVDVLEKIIAKDPTISAKILSFANSAFFGAKGAIKTIHDAVIRIGFKNVKNISVGISLMTVLHEGEGDTVLDYQRIFKHSATVGMIAKMLAEKLAPNISEEIFINGILHDIGLLVLNKYFRDLYQKVLKESKNSVPVLTSEREMMGFTHAEIGTWLADKWKLPNSVLDTTLYHHTPALAKENLKHVAVTHLSDFIAIKKVYSVIEGNSDYPLDMAALEILEINEEYISDFEKEINKDVLMDSIFK